MINGSENRTPPNGNYIPIGAFLTLRYYINTQIITVIQHVEYTLIHSPSNNT